MTQSGMEQRGDTQRRDCHIMQNSDNVQMDRNAAVWEPLTVYLEKAYRRNTRSDKNMRLCRHWIDVQVPPVEVRMLAPNKPTPPRQEP